jgi:hypothetical protein
LQKVFTKLKLFLIYHSKHARWFIFMAEMIGWCLFFLGIYFRVHIIPLNVLKVSWRFCTSCSDSTQNDGCMGAHLSATSFWNKIYIYILYIK